MAIIRRKIRESTRHTRILAHARRWADGVSQAVATRLLVDLGHYLGAWIRSQFRGMAG